MIAVIERRVILEQRILVDRLADVMRAAGHAFGFELRGERVGVAVYAEHVEPPRVLAAGCDLRAMQTFHVRKTFMKLAAPRASSRNDRIELAKLRDGDGGLELGH